MTSLLSRVVMDGTDATAVRKDQGQSAFAARECGSEQYGGAQRDPVCGRAGLQMAWFTGPVRQVAHHLCADESLGQERGARPGVREAATGADRAHQDRSHRARLDFGEGAPRWYWSVKKNGPQAIGKSRGGWNTKIHMVAANARTAITFALSPGNAHDAPEGRALLEELGPMPDGLPLLMDKAYEDNLTRQLVLDLGMIPVVPPKSNRIEPWEYDRALYRKRNEIERLFRRLKGFR